ncbi:hypothetical protein LIER_07361 [Lithospermum erythrorhizon]|uniref:Integrase catalytic domain-containing protein n=1 Tax=Lithospermum erythrorhizon TaxID=34254 RepID=A0AAV3P965_LITER
MEMWTKMGIEHRFALVCYPWYNGQVEVMNRTIFTGIKKNLLESGTQCYKELDRVLWSYRTTPSNSTSSLVYGTEAVLTIEVCFSILQVGFDEDKNSDRKHGLLDFTDELRDQALYRMREQKRRISRFYNRQVKGRQFSMGDVVLRIDHTWNEVYLKKYYV